MRKKAPNSTKQVPPKAVPFTKSKSLKGPLVKVIKADDKSQLQKEIEEKKLPLIENYTKDLIDIDIKIEEYNNKAKPSSTQESQSKDTAKQAPPHPKPKKDDEIKKTIGKIEKMYAASLKATEEIKLSEASSTEELLKQEVLYLKTKNEVLRLKGEFFENIFYTSKNLIETYQMQSELKDKLIGIFTQNNQHYYETFNFLQKKQFDIFSIEKSADNDMLINKKSLNVLNTIEDNLMLILRDIQTLIKEIALPSSSIVFKLKESIISSSKKILSYYVLSDNYSFDFKGRNTFWINNVDDYAKFDAEKRSNKLIENFTQIIDPMLNKVMNKKNKKDLTSYLGSVCSFYENYNQLLINENYHLKCFNSSTLTQLSCKAQQMQRLIDEFIASTQEPFIKLTEIINFLFGNQSKNMEKVVYSLLNTEKNKIQAMIGSYSQFINQYMLIR